MISTWPNAALLNSAGTAGFMGRLLRILSVDDEAEDFQTLYTILLEHAFVPVLEQVSTSEALDAALARSGWDLVFLSYRAAGQRLDAAETIRRVRAASRQLPIVVLTDGAEDVPDLARLGVDEFVPRRRLHRLGPVVQRALRLTETRREGVRVRERLARSEEQLRRWMDRSAALADLSRQFAQAELDFASTLRIAAEAVARLLGDLCVVRLLSEDGEFLDPVAVHHRDPEARALVEGLVYAGRRHAWEDIAGWVVEHREAVFLPSLSPELVRENVREELWPYVERFGLSSILCVPITASGRVLGTLFATRGRPEEPYTEEDWEFLQDLADRAALAISNAQLHAAVHRQLDERARQQAGLVAARDRAEEQARVKAAFLANMSHEIRTPLTAILGFASILASEVPPDCREYAELIERSGRRLLDTLGSVLELARLEAGAVELHFEPVPLVARLEEALRLLAPLAEAKGLTLELRADVPEIAVETDPGSLDRILNNLLGNAIKYTETGGVTVELETGPEAVRLRVRDTGIGIGTDFLPRLFGEFAREPGRTPGREGSGLGLAITRRLLDRLGSTISVESRKGAGSCFTVVLPIRQ